MKKQRYSKYTNKSDVDSNKIVNKITGLKEQLARRTNIFPVGSV